MPEHMAGFQRKTIRAMGLNSSEEQEATFGAGPWEGAKRRTTTLFVVRSERKITQRH